MGAEPETGFVNEVIAMANINHEKNRKNNISQSQNKSPKNI
jgi:hypothetical protein